MATYYTSDEELTSVADKIRKIGGTTIGLQYPEGWKIALDALPVVGTAHAIQPLTVNQNGTYNPPAGVVDGFGPVTVNVSGGGGTAIIDGGSHETQQNDFEGAYPNKAGIIRGPNQNDEALTTCATCIGYDLGAVNSDATCYAVIKCTSYGYPQRILSIRYDGSTGNEPMYFVYNSSGKIGYTTYNNDKVLSSDYVYDKHVYAISLNNTTKKARFYLDGVFIEELQFSNSGRYVNMCGNAGGSIARSNLYFAGCVHGSQTDQEVIANSLALKAYYSIGA